MKKTPTDLRRYLVCAILFFGTLILFSRVVRHDFIDLDDPDYITQNSHVHAGLTWAGAQWAFTSTSAGNWHPLTWLSHMLDWQLFGNNPHGHHATNIFLHALNAALAFLALRKLTGAFWMSAVCAALFAWHPLRVESVAWVAERKDVLSGFFFWTALLCYAKARVVEVGQSPAVTPQRAALFYWLTLLFFACGLMSKPMLVTFPFVLLLVDFWPLQRSKESTIWRLLIEKIPFFILSAGVCIITYLAQKKGGAIVENVTLDARLTNAFVSVAGYLGKLFWPFDLAVTYSLPSHWPASTVVGSVLLTLAITLAAIWQWRQRPWLVFGWFWFLGMLVPVIGLVQAGRQAMADRYSYLPVIGLQIALLWTLGNAKFFAQSRWLAAGLSVVVLAGCAMRAWSQEGYWKNSQALYEHAIAVTKNNYLAHSNLGTTLFNEHQFPDAEQQFRSAIEIDPDFATAHFKLGLMLEEEGREDDALNAYLELVKIRPHDADANYNIGVILLNRGQPGEAIPHFQTAIESENNYASAYAGLGSAQLQTGQTWEALANLEKVLQLNPDFPGVADTVAELTKKIAAEQSGGQK
jgi:tetratricopeptide (TPR) repeat protein